MSAHDSAVRIGREPSFDHNDVTSIINRLFEMNAELADIGADVASIRRVLEEEDDEADE